MGGSAAQGISATQKREKEKAAAIAASKLTANVKLATAEAKALMAAAKTYSNPDVGFKFNLPPHDWSLPVRPVILDYDYLRKNSSSSTLPSPVISDPAVQGRHVVGGSSKSSNHGLRRSRIWFFGGLESSTIINPDGTTTTNAEKTGKSLIEAAKVGQYNPGSGASVLDRQYGFQFLWNPTDINVTVNRNADITPSAADRSGQLTGNFQGQEQITFSILIDRTNDFACARGLVDANGNINVNSLTKYYNAFYPSEDKKSITVETKIRDLLKFGTMADIEYLFKAINGGGVYITDPKTGKTTYQAWTNGLGKVTADTGYLTSSIIAVQFGPPGDSLSYTGWFESISIAHSKFTENMIPLTSQVNITMTGFSTHPY